MLTGRRFWTFAMVFVLAIVTVTAGCRRRSGSRTTINQGGADIFTTDEFPGDDVQNGNVADDERAMSVSGDDMSNDSLKCTMNGSRGTAMITYNTDDDGTWAQHYDGSSWTPPVSLRALDLSSGFAESSDDIIHAFVNTEEHDSDFARDRNGDCVIVWRGRDVDTASDGDVDGDEDNVCVFMTYFDATHHSEAGARYGFQEFATRINSQDEDEENVSTIAVVTDGLCGEARWFDGFNDYSYGDQTSSIEVVFRIDENNDADEPSTGGEIEDVALWSARIDLASAIDAEIPLGVSVLTRLGVVGFGASDGGTDSEETQVFSTLRSYNNTLWFLVLSNDARGADEANSDFNTGTYPATFAADDDITLQYVTYDLSTGGITSVTDLNPGPVDSTADGFENNADLLGNAFLLGFAGQPEQAIFGTDEGLAVTTIFYLQVVETTGAGSPTITESAHLWMAEVDQTDGSLDSISQVSPEDVDEQEGINNDAFVDIEISRNGDYILVAWIQNEDVVAGAGNDAFQFGLWTSTYVTTRPDEDGAFILPSTIDSLSLADNVGPSSLTETIEDFFIQECLGYICGAQSNADIMSIFFEQSDGTNDEFFQVEVVTDLVLPTSPGTTTFSFETFEDGDQTANFGSIFPEALGSFRATDSGFDGFIFASYIDDVDGTGTDDYRQFAERTGPFSAGVVQIDSNVFFRNVEDAYTIPEFICLPPGEEIGTFDVVDLEDDEKRHHGNSRIHVFIFEDRVTETYDTDALRTREFVTEDNGNTMGDNFLPNAGTVFVDPFTFDLPGIDPNDTPSIIGVGRSGERAGVWFEFVSHIYYQESGGGDPNDGDNAEAVSWLTFGDPGVSDPFLVDDDNDEELQEVIDFCSFNCVCDDLSGAMVFWTKAFGSGSGGGQNFRLQVRVRSGE